ncbi:PepSY domain-containing protein [Ruminiclostridium herbifermentans]|uniref:PepSY domain-containing protein n=1 Tax=Ruminiclostridium herbifermentans TaxID=2488810 RepID=A0A4V6EN05_9FIRM|nr:PepSY domain-containing protein [Ruminiclostridium herbifermentans]QNU67284.1 PepSY domain-containing protein [Ruminiclostridium herbifermentans]
MHNYGYRNSYYPTLWDNYWRSYRINAESAIQIALSQVPGQVLKVELDYDDGLLVYEIYIRTTHGIYEVNVNALTGQILKVEKEYD